MVYKLRSYQEECVKSISSYINSDRNDPVLVIGPVGCGKSLLIAEAARLMGDKTLVLQPSKELLQQNYDKLTSYGIPATIYSASCGKKELSNMIYATLGSVKKVIGQLKEMGIRNVLIDEAHAGYSPEEDSEFMKFMNELKPSKVIGFTATPCRLKTMSIGQVSYSQLNFITRMRPVYFKNLIHVIQVEEMIRQGFWTPLKYETWDFNGDALRLNSNGSEYTAGSISEAVRKNGLNNLILRRLMVLKDICRSILVFMDSVESCNTAAEWINAKICAGMAEVVHGGTPKKQREAIVERFKSGGTRVVFNYSALGTGFDHPGLDCVMFGRPTFSFSTWYQACLDMETEILTERGFLKYHEISKDDIVASYDNGDIYWVNIEDIVYRDVYDGERFVTFNSRHANLRVTEDHDLLVKNKWDKQNGYPYKKEEAIKSYQRGTSFYIPVAGVDRKRDYPFLRNCDIKFLGYFLSDGNLSKYNNSITIAQSLVHPDIIDDIENTIKECGMKYNKIRLKRKGELANYEDMIHFKISKGMPIKDQKDKHGWEYLGDFIDKNCGSIYDHLSERQFDILLDAIDKGDGLKKKDMGSYKRRGYTICLKNNKIYADRIQQLAVTRGYRCCVHKEITKTGFVYRGYFKKQNYICIDGQNAKDQEKVGKYIYSRAKMKIDIPNEDEKVWCVRNRIGTIIIRRRGDVAIVGNCGRAVRIKDGKDSALVVDCCNNSSRFGDIRKLSIENYKGYGWGMFIGDKLITNIPMGNKVTKTDLDIKAAKKDRRRGLAQGVTAAPVPGRPDHPLGSTLMTFGKYCGWMLHSIPVSYFKFINETFDWDNDRNKDIKEYIDFLIKNNRL